jgi:hypothetical protein
MSITRGLFRFFAVVNAIASLVTLYSVGFATLITTVLGWYVSTLDKVPPGVVILFSVGSFLIQVAAFSQLLPRLFPSMTQSAFPLAAVPQLSPPRREVAALAVPDTEGPHETKPEYREALHEALATLQWHEGILRNWIYAYKQFSPTYQGHWGENRSMLSANPKYDAVIQYTNRAFNSLARIPQGETMYHQPQADAVRDVGNAMAILEAALEADTSG